MDYEEVIPDAGSSEDPALYREDSDMAFSMHYSPMAVVGCTGPYQTRPERLLLTAMLERAIRDLKNGSKDDLISALRWFSVKKDNPECLTFIYCKDILELSALQLVQIAALVVEGRARLIAMAAVVGKERKTRGLFTVEDEYLTHDKRGVAVLKFRKRLGSI